MTPFEKIYKMFLTEVRSYEFFDMSDEQLEAELVELLESAVAYFDMYSQVELSDADFTIPDGHFNVELSLIEQKILAHYMLVSHIASHLNNLESSIQVLNSRDYRVYSEANFLSMKQKMKEQAQSELNRLLSRYSYVEPRKRKK